MWHPDFARSICHTTSIPLHASLSCTTIRHHGVAQVADHAQRMLAQASAELEAQEQLSAGTAPLRQEGYRLDEVAQPTVLQPHSTTQDLRLEMALLGSYPEAAQQQDLRVEMALLGSHPEAAQQQDLRAEMALLGSHPEVAQQQDLRVEMALLGSHPEVAQQQDLRVEMALLGSHPEAAQQQDLRLEMALLGSHPEAAQQQDLRLEMALLGSHPEAAQQQELGSHPEEQQDLRWRWHCLDHTLTWHNSRHAISDWSWHRSRGHCEQCLQQCRLGWTIRQLT